MAVFEVVCAGCGDSFEAKSARAKWCSHRCRRRKQREGKPAEVDEATDQPAPLDEGLVLALRRELEQAQVVDTFAGQLALQLARKVAAVDATGVSGLAKELRAIRAEALEQKPAAAAAADEGDVPDEVTEARKRRDAKTRKAASRS